MERGLLRYRVAPLTIINEGEYYLVGNPATDDFYQFPPVAVDILTSLKGGATADAVIADFHRRGNNVDVADLIDTLLELGLIGPWYENSGTEEVGNQAVDLSRPFSLVVAAGRAIFSPVGLVAYLLVTGGALVVVLQRPDLVPSVSALAFDRNLTVTMLALLILHGAAVMVHEASHMLAAARHGVRTKLGFSNRLWSIVAEADLTGILALPRQQRYLPLAAGMLADIFLVGLCTLLLAVFSTAGSATVGPVLIKALILQILLTIGWQFNFYLRTDVYYLLCNYARQPRLDLDAQEYRSSLVYAASGGRLGRAVVHAERFGPAVQLFALLWLVGRVIALAALFFVFLPTIFHYVTLAATTLNDRHASGYRKLDMLFFAISVVLLMSIGMGMWLLNTVRASRRKTNDFQ